MEGLYQNQAALEAEELRATREQLLHVERSTLQDLQRQGTVDSTIAQHLAAEIDARLVGETL
jgi:hypothetical protein